LAAGIERPWSVLPLWLHDRLAAAERAGSVGPHPESKAPEVADGAGDDLELRAAGGAGRSRVVGDADFDDAAAGRA
jgi:hypothetical protein